MLASHKLMNSVAHHTGRVCTKSRLERNDSSPRAGRLPAMEGGSAALPGGTMDLPARESSRARNFIRAWSRGELKAALMRHSHEGSP